MSRKPEYVLAASLALAVLISFPLSSRANDLKDETLAAWNTYITSANGRCVSAGSSDAHFLVISEFPDRRLRVRGGETSVWRQDDVHPAHVPHGLIHDWMGAVFIPGATIADVFAVSRDYDRYAQIYDPAVVEASGIAPAGNDDDRFSMLLMQKVLFVTAAMKGEYETRYVQVDPKRWYSISQSTRLQAVEKYGQPDMRVLPPDQGPGYVWRLYSIAKYEETDGGVYIELEAIGLSRDVPLMLRWMVDPIVAHLPKDSLLATLEKTRTAVLAKVGQDQRTLALKSR